MDFPYTKMKNTSSPPSQHPTIMTPDNHKKISLANRCVSFTRENTSVVLKCV